MSQRLTADAGHTIRGLFDPARAIAPVVGRLIVEIGDRARAVSDSFDAYLLQQARTRLDSLGNSLRRAVAARSYHFPRIYSHPDVRFALDDLVPSRIAAAKRYLVITSKDDVLTLLHFLDLARQGGSARVRGATTPEEVADSLLGTLDDLHGYLLSHDLVSRQYRRSQSLAWVSEMGTASFRSFRTKPAVWRTRGHTVSGKRTGAHAKRRVPLAS